MTKVTGRVAVVVGAGSGLGQATALNLAAQGWRVVAVDRNEEGLAALPSHIATQHTDATDPSVVGPLFERIAHDVGAPEALVNTIGIFELGDAMSTTPDHLRLAMDINLGSALWLSQSVAPYMEQKGSGSIVHITSRPGLEATPGMAAYAVSKAALVHLVRVLDLELRPLGIRVNAVAPQLIETAKNEAMLPADVMAHAVSPEAIAEVVAFLLSDAAAPVSGAILPAYGA